MANYLGFSLFVVPWAAGLSAVIWLVVYGVVRIPFIASFVMIFVLSAGQAYFSIGHWVRLPVPPLLSPLSSSITGRT